MSPKKPRERQLLNASDPEDQELLAAILRKAKEERRSISGQFWFLLRKGWEAVYPDEKPHE